MEEADDIQKVPANVGGASEVKNQVSSQTDSAREDRAPEVSPANISSLELPPHLVLDMPALSPTMVWKVNNWLFNFHAILVSFPVNADEIFV